MAARGPSEQLTFQSGAGSYDPLGLVGCCTVALAVAVVLILIYRAARTRRATGGQHEHTATHTDSWDKSSERTVRRRGRKSASHSQTTGKLKRPLNKIPKPEESTPLECERDCQVEWKFVLIEDGKICRWEECCNRHLYTGHDEAISLNKCWGYI
ncbi:starch-binding domain-containing protein 1 [Arapaima gigas]